MFGVEVKFAFVGVISRSRGVFVREWLGGSVTKALVGANAIVESALGHSTYLPCRQQGHLNK